MFCLRTMCCGVDQKKFREKYMSRKDQIADDKDDRKIKRGSKVDDVQFDSSAVPEEFTMQNVTADKTVD